MIEKYTIYHGGSDLPDGKTIPVHVRVGEQWEKVGEGVFDRKNGFFDVEIDTDSDAGKMFADSSSKMQVGGFSIVPTKFGQNNGENYD